MLLSARYPDLPDGVREVLCFVEGGGILAPSAPAARDAFTVVTDLAEAEDAAGGLVRFDYPVSSAERQVASLTWEDINEREMAGVWEVLYDREVDALYQQVCAGDDFYGYVTGFTPSEYADLSEWFADDLANCVASRLAFGEGDRFYDHVFRAYEAGGWPCGWDAANRRLMVYFP